MNVLEASVNLASIDLNLLVALDALLTERHVTRAAKVVGLTQPAMSNALSRLRTLLGDPLFVRTADGMQPTPRAEGLAIPLAEALRQIRDSILRPTTFDPKTASVTFNIATADFELLVLVPALTERLAATAPGVRLHCTTPRGRLPIDDLMQGKIDLMIGIRQEDHPGLFKARLFDERYLCALRGDHPDAAKKLTLARYAALDHMLISPYGGMTGTVDGALAAAGLSRNVKLAVPHFAMAPFVLLRTPYVLTLPERAARLFAANLPIRLVPPPLELQGFTEYLFWHERTQNDPAHKWLRGVIKDVAAEA